MVSGRKVHPSDSSEEANKYKVEPRTVPSQCGAPLYLRFLYRVGAFTLELIPAGQLRTRRNGLLVIPTFRDLLPGGWSWTPPWIWVVCCFLIYV